LALAMRILVVTMVMHGSESSRSEAVDLRRTYRWNKPRDVVA
jgi:hypothetical protein